VCKNGVKIIFCSFLDIRQSAEWLRFIIIIFINSIFQFQYPRLGSNLHFMECTLHVSIGAPPPPVKITRRAAAERMTSAQGSTHGVMSGSTPSPS